MIPLSDTRTRCLRPSSQATLVRCDRLRADRNNHDASNRLGVRGLMPDWVRIEISDFMNFVREDERPSDVVGRIILDRLPYTFDSKKQYFSWRGVLGEGLQVDARDIVIVGSAATGRSLNPRTKFGVFGKSSDVDIAIISPMRFDQAWLWFRQADPNLLGLDDFGQHLFEQHRKQYIFEGMIAANYFLSYLPFGFDWNRELQRSEKYLPPLLRGRQLSVRIYRDSEALRCAQLKSFLAYQKYLRVKDEPPAGAT